MKNKIAFIGLIVTEVLSKTLNLLVLIYFVKSGGTFPPYETFTKILIGSFFFFDKLELFIIGLIRMIPYGVFFSIYSLIIVIVWIINFVIVFLNFKLKKKVHILIQILFIIIAVVSHLLLIYSFNLIAFPS